MSYIVTIECSESSKKSLEGIKKRLSSFGYSFAEISSSSDIESVNPMDARMALVGIDIETDDDSLAELLGQFRAKFPKLEMLAVFSGQLKFGQQFLFDADLEHIYHYPFDDELIINHVFDEQPIAMDNSELSFEHLARVNVTELKAGDKLPFGLFVYLPANQKIIPYNHKDQPLDEEVLAKFRKNSHYSLYVSKLDLSDYYAYCSSELKESLGELEGKEFTQKITGQMKSLMTGFFDEKQLDEKESSQLLDNLGKIVSTLEDKSGAKQDLVAAVNRLASHQLTNYTHSKNMGTYCSIFGMMAGIHEPQSLRIGGMLHDLGMKDLPVSLLQKDIKDMDEMELAQFKLHPGNGKLGVIEKGLKIPKAVENMIMQHHEQPNGEGFPYGLTSEDIDPMAKVCAFADVFDTLTSVREGYRQLTPRQAMERIAGLDGDEPELVFESQFHMPIVENFLSGNTIGLDDDVFDEHHESDIASEEVKEPGLGSVQDKVEKSSYGSVKGQGSSNDSKQMKSEDKMEYVISQLMEEDQDDEGVA